MWDHVVLAGNVSVLYSSLSPLSFSNWGPLHLFGRQISSNSDLRFRNVMTGSSSSRMEKTFVFKPKTWVAGAWAGVFRSRPSVRHSVDHISDLQSGLPWALRCKWPIEVPEKDRKVIHSFIFPFLLAKLALVFMCRFEAALVFAFLGVYWVTTYKTLWLQVSQRHLFQPFSALIHLHSSKRVEYST